MELAVKTSRAEAVGQSDRVFRQTAVQLGNATGQVRGVAKQADGMEG